MIRLLQALLLTALAHGAALPKPSGSYAVGSRSFIWTDPQRTESLRTPHEPRVLSVQVFYPADPGTGREQPYLPDWPLWLKQVGERRLRETLGPAFDAASSAKSEVCRDAHLARGSAPYPLLVFLPGLGMNVSFYTALLSDLASHGYVLLAVNPTYEVVAATIGNERAVGFSSPGWFRPPVEKIIEYEKGRLVVWAADASFALHKLQNEPDFKQRVNWNKLGALGHSAGARVVAHLCQTEPAVSACLNLDGFAGFQPFFAEEGSTFRKAFAMVHMALPDPADDAMLREKSRQRNAGIKLFESVQGGSVEVTLSTPGIQHGSFTDLPILGDAAGDPLLAMTHIRNYSKAFFDGALKGIQKTALTDDRTPAGVLLERYQFKGPVAR